ncbi:hypothetical protein FHT76_007878 [Rhizobium sp. BK176]|nr:hypothetical protein [Rhizobium sp. BK399]MCS4096157.1 hypothetical protein [Rhizobium sp. BK176]
MQRALFIGEFWCNPVHTSAAFGAQAGSSVFEPGPARNSSNGGSLQLRAISFVKASKKKNPASLRGLEVNIEMRPKARAQLENS